MEQIQFKVIGMTCGGCVASVKKALTQDGVNKVDVQLDTGLVTIDYDGARQSAARLRQSIETAGYDVT